MPRAGGRRRVACGAWRSSGSRPATRTGSTRPRTCSTGPRRADETARTLREPTHHLLIAYEDGEPAGFVCGVEVTHPDKPTEMMLYELGVDEPRRRRGIGRALVRSLAELADERGCASMFVLTERTNEAAIATYAFGDPVREDDFVMFTWKTRG